MQAFSKCKNYDDYISIIKESFVNGVSYIDSNESGYTLLLVVKDSRDQKKIMDVIKLIDQELSFSGSHNDEMWKKIDYILALGIYSHKYKEYFDKLTVNQIFTLILGEFSYFNEYNKDYVSLFSNQELLDSIYQDSLKKELNKDYSLFGYNDYFFMMHEHFEKNPFNLNNNDSCNKFRKEMISRIESNKLHDGVMNMVEYWNSNEEIRNVVLGGKIK